MEKYCVTETSSGRVRGRIREKGMREYLGVPYGKAERFCPPEPVRWGGVLECLEYRGQAMQPDRLGEYPAGMMPRVLGTEDCLHLNIWAAEHAPGEKLPVVVYIHGGAFQVGSAQEPARAGDLFMEEDRMIFVSVEYRMGVLGFLQLGEEMGEKYVHSGSCGALDVLTAMKWIHENIGAFGGDPGLVTLFGISAGAKLIGSLLTVPGMQELCGQVVLESGAMQSFRTRKTARKVTEKYKELLGIREERELLFLPAEVLTEAQGRFCNTPGSTCFFGPVLEEEAFDRNWIMDLPAGRGWRGRAILGSGLRELAGMSERPDFSEKKDLILYNLFGTNADIAEQKLEELSREEETAAWTKVLSDLMYRSYTDLLAKRLTAAGSPLWVYSFEYLPATHGMGFSFLMKNRTRKDPSVTAEEERKRLVVSDAMRRAVRRFICGGIPDEPDIWPEYRGGTKMIFDGEPHCEDRPRDSLEGLPEMMFRW